MLYNSVNNPSLDVFESCRISLVTVTITSIIVNCPPNQRNEVSIHIAGRGPPISKVSDNSKQNLVTHAEQENLFSSSNSLYSGHNHFLQVI